MNDMRTALAIVETKLRSLDQVERKENVALLVQYCTCLATLNGFAGRLPAVLIRPIPSQGNLELESGSGLRHMETESRSTDRFVLLYFPALRIPLPRRMLSYLFRGCPCTRDDLRKLCDTCIASNKRTFQARQSVC